MIIVLRCIAASDHVSETNVNCPSDMYRCPRKGSSSAIAIVIRMCLLTKLTSMSECMWAAKSCAGAGGKGRANLFFSILGGALRLVSGVVSCILCLGNLFSSAALDVARSIIDIAAGKCSSSTLICPMQTCTSMHIHDRPVISSAVWNPRFSSRDELRSNHEIRNGKRPT